MRAGDRRSSSLARQTFRQTAHLDIESIMFLATENKAQRLLYLSYIGKVSVADLERGYDDIKSILADFPLGFRLLADFSLLESVDLACVDVIGRMMELMDGHGLELIVRVVPDSSKDFGFKIIAIFHYSRNPRMIGCETMQEAARALGL
jgi:hypothetical protein